METIVAKRKPLGKKIRFEVFKRDAFTCGYCGSTPPSVVLEIDHIVAVANGGDNSEDNLLTSCFDCNRGKAANRVDVIPEPLKEKAKRIKEAEKQLIEYTKIIKAKEDRLEDETWDLIVKFEPSCERFNNRWFSSIKNYIDKMGFYEVVGAMEISVNKFHRINSSAMKYFHGVCKNKMKGVHYE